MAVQGLYWFLVGKRVRGKRLIWRAATHHARYYRFWTRFGEPSRVAEWIVRQAPRDDYAPPPNIAFLILPDASSIHGPSANSSSLSASFEPHHRVYVCGTDNSAWSALEAAAFASPATLAARIAADGPADWLVILSANDRLASFAPQVLGLALAEARSDIVFWDEDRIDAVGHRDAPWLKHAWDELHFLGRDGLTGACALRLAALVPLTEPGLETVPGPLWNAELTIRLLASPECRGAQHVPLILTHRQQVGLCQAARAGHIARHWPGSPTLVPGDCQDIARIDFPAPAAWPKVSIIVPTRNGLELMRQCMIGVDQLDYPGSVELVIADNDSDDPAIMKLFREREARGARIVSCPGPFNFSAMNNCAAQAASGEMICLLNNDVEMLDGQWLTRMVRHALEPGVGAVGALLLYPDRTIQHCGVAIGVGGAAGHVYRGLVPEDRGNGWEHRSTRRVSVVTAACLVVRRQLFQAVGALDEVAFPVAFNDVDFCLRLDRAGYRNILVAEAILIHHESKSRGSDMLSANRARYMGELSRLQARWGTAKTCDPYHNPQISRESEEFILAL